MSEIASYHTRRTGGISALRRKRYGDSLSLSLPGGASSMISSIEMHAETEEGRPGASYTHLFHCGGIHRVWKNGDIWASRHVFGPPSSWLPEIQTSWSYEHLCKVLSQTKGYLLRWRRGELWRPFLPVSLRNFVAASCSSWWNRRWVL
jgi:hypothetical protein